MSRKTISIKMPGADAVDWNSAAAGAGAPTATFDSPAAAHAESDRWIRAGDLVPLPAPAPRYAIVDLSAERTLAQVLALSFALPSVLGWFWLANSLDRWRRLFAV